MKKQSFLSTIACVIAIMFFGCENDRFKDFEKSSTGLYYRFHAENPTKHAPENDEIVSMVMSIQTENDSVIQSPRHVLTAMQNPKFKGDIFDALSMMHEGDSATFIINAEKYYRSYNYGQVPDFAKNEKVMLWFTIKIDSVITFKEYQSAIAREKWKQETEAIAQYLQTNRLEASPLENGMYYIETKQGRGKSPQEGQICVMNYTGTFLNGDIFDTSVGRGAFDFQLGRGMVIQGWEIGVAMMKKGGKAILVLPSSLAYGERGAGNIPPNTPLVFEVELLDIRLP
ncbi:MAG: FKBP-type peptidyl-prolyl cis-trans isomerase [Bacteroidales bacterium]|nr:FKBP-type peptidyl-prolyl cis-trans isomerase [Bacteroidales bacterium]